MSRSVRPFFTGETSQLAPITSNGMLWNFVHSRLLGFQQGDAMSCMCTTAAQWNLKISRFLLFTSIELPSSPTTASFMLAFVSCLADTDRP